jgi:multidrug efflux system outer membrane protein
VIRPGVLACLAAVFQLGCAIGPNYKPTKIEVPEQFRGTLEAKQAQSLADLPWWKIFDDPVLVGLIEEALESNLNLRVAVARNEQAYRQMRAVQSDFYPQIGYQGSGGKYRSPVGRKPGDSLTYTNYGGALQAAWEIDVWGRLRRANESARAQLLASEDFQRGVLLTLVADVASLYFSILELDAAHSIAKEAVAAFQDTLLLFTRKYEGGVASKLQVTRAGAALAQAAALVPGIEINIAAVENQLSVLLARTPGDIPRGRNLNDQHLPTLPPGLPSALLERRPDIQQAEQAVISSNAQVGVAMGNFLPRVGLVALWGGSSETLGGLASGSASVWNLAGELSGPIFQGGLLYAQYKGQQAFWEESKANYELTALNAFGEVSSIIVENNLRKEQRVARQEAVEQLRESVRISLIRYDQGLANYFEVLEAQQDLYPAELNLAEIRLEERLSVIKLYRALGGGWNLGLDWLPPAPDEAAPAPGAEVSKPPPPAEETAAR